MSEQQQAPGAAQPRTEALPRLEPGRNCWRIERAARATPLVDAADYFSMLAATMRRAEREILIVGWDVHALVRLERDGARGRAGATLRELLAGLAGAKPELSIRILLWDFTVLYAADRFPFPKAVLDWSMPANVSLALDNRLPVGAAHHQKIVVVDDAVAFVGGIDLTEKRWDTSTHAAGDRRRVTSRGEAYMPFHDLQLAVDGGAAAALGELCRRRWTDCTGETLEEGAPARSAAGAGPWPEAVAPYWRDIGIAIARTLPAVETTQRSVDEILHLYLDTIAAAERYIYIENQYLTAERVCDALVERLEHPDGPEIVFVTQTNTHTWLEENTMGVRRRRFLGRLQRADAHGRLRVVAPRVPGVDVDDYKLHSKLMIVDDAGVRIGSANLNNRSMGFDSECDLLVACETSEQRTLARGLLNALLAEHLGVETEAVARAIETRGGLVAAVDALAGRERTLVPIRLDESEPVESEMLAEEMLAELADRERPLSAQELLDRLAPESEAGLDKRAVRTGFKLGLALLAIVAGVVVWHATGLENFVEPETVARFLARAPNGIAGGLVALAAFVIGGLVVFPVTALIFASALTYGPWLGLAYAVVGTYASAAATFAVGRLLGRRPPERWPLTPVAAVSRQLARRGVLAIAVLRIVPVAPFTVVNVLAGASQLKFRDYAIGTVLGMTPGIVVLTALGGQLASVLRHPTAGQIATFAVLGVVWLALGLGLQRFVNRIERKRDAEGAS